MNYHKLPLLALICLLLGLDASAQTTLIDPTGATGIDGGFNIDNAWASYAWTQVNTGQTNNWRLRNNPTGSTGRCAYIRTNTSNNHTYDNTTASVSHFYVDVTFPAGETSIVLDFDWKCDGEWGYDFMTVHLVPTSTTPVAGTQLGTGQIGLTEYGLAGSDPWQNESITIAGSNAGTTRRLVFTWVNDGSLGTNPPAAVDNISLVTSPPFANDECAGAISLTSNATCVTTAGTTSGATQSQAGCYGTADDDVWYSFTATQANHDITVAGSASFDAVIELFSGTCGSLSSITCMDDWGTGTSEVINATGLTPGNTYYVRTYDYGSSAPADPTFTICVEDGPASIPNDACAGAISVTCGNTYAGTIVGSNSTDAPAYCGTTNYEGIWYVFTGTGANVTAQLCGSAYDSKMSVYSGSCGALTCIDGEDDDGVICGDDDPSIEFTTSIGTDYYIYVTGYAGDTGPFTLDISCVVPGPPNCAGIVSPADATTLSCASTDLEWSVPGGADAATGYDIYFGTDNPPTNIENGTDLGNVLTYSAGALAANTTYYWQVVPYNGAGDAVGCSVWSFTTGPSAAPNDNPCNATVISLNVNNADDNSCAGNSGEGVPACWTTGAINDLWYTVTAPASGQLQVRTTEGSISGTQIALYSGTCGSLTYVDCNQDQPICGSSQYENSHWTGAVTPGATYWIRIDGESGSTGTFSILAMDGNDALPYTAQDCPQPNPVCNQILTIGDPGYQAIGNYCDFDDFATSCLASGERGTVFYEIEISTTGTLEFNIEPNDFTGTVGLETDYDFALWDVTGLSNYCADVATGTLADISCNYSGDGVTGCWTTPTAPYDVSGGYEPGIAVTAGETYLLVISNYSNSTSGFSIDFFGTSPINYITAPTTVTWTGALSNDWFNAENWGSCGIPDCSTDVVISPASTNQPVIGAAGATCGSITIDAGSTLTINAGYTLDVCEDWTNSGNFSAAAASTVNFMGTGTQNVNGSLTGLNAFDNVTVTKTTGSVVLQQDTEIEGNLTTSNATSVFDANGMTVFLGGDFNNFQNSTTYLVNNSTLEFNGTTSQDYNPGGTLNLHNVVMNHTGPGLTIDTDNLVISPSGSLTLTQGKIVTSTDRVIVNNTASAAVSAGNTTSYVEGNLRRYITGSTSYDFPVGHASTGYQRANVAFTTATSINYLDGKFDPYPGALPGWLGASECLVATYNHDALDNGLFTIDASNNPTSGTYNMTLYNTAGSYTNHTTASGWTVMKNSGSGWGLDGNCVTSSTVGVVGRTGMNGFSTFATAQNPGTSPLPVELLSFDGRAEEGYNHLMWVTSTEINSDYFIVQRSLDGQSFSAIGTVEAAGNSTSSISYTLKDTRPVSGVMYYRLKTVDLDGTSSLSQTIAIDVPYPAVTVASLYPNPAKQQAILDIEAQVEGRIDIKIRNVAGQLVRHQKASIEAGKQQIQIDLQGLANGIYTVQVSAGDEKALFRERLVKQ